MGKNFAIIHFSPLELYPPVQNLLNYISEGPSKKTIFVFTTATGNVFLNTFETPAPFIKIIRLGTSGNDRKAWKRYLNYIHFFAGCLWHLIVKGITSVVYYETISAYPAYLLKRYFRRSAKIFIHYHEYTSPEEYAKGMKLTKYFHQKEKWLYPRAAWLSHTNHYRMEMFKKDIAPVPIMNAHLLPNYPPLSWKAVARDEITMPVRMVYVGALSLDTMYTKQFAEWISLHPDQFQWDIYSHNMTADARLFLQMLNAENIHVKAGVDYKTLPGILKNYSVGVILYNGHIPNYIFNAPNKLFEYLSCGLDVWYPGIMIASNEFTSTGTYPKVMALDFDHLSTYDVGLLTDRSGLLLKDPFFFAENVLQEFTGAIFADNN